VTGADESGARRIGRRIAAARRAAGLTQAELAQRLGWPRDTLIHYEHGRRALSIDRLSAIADALTLHPASLLIADERLAALVQRVLCDTEVQAQVDFFLSALDQ
jgi:transcriptional regulator with XRE-family HTH domain